MKAIFRSGVARENSSLESHGAGGHLVSSRLVSGRSNILLTLASRLSHLTARVSHLKVLRLSGGLTRWSSHLPFPCLFSI